VANADDALDLVQDTFLRAARSPQSIPDGPSDEEAWLVRVLVNLRRDRSLHGTRTSTDFHGSDSRHAYRGSRVARARPSSVTSSRSRASIRISWIDLRSSVSSASRETN
jgi:DNA-directed RNA polymerase specialized sigma24 family protein